MLRRRWSCSALLCIPGSQRKDFNAKTIQMASGSEPREVYAASYSLTFEKMRIYGAQALARAGQTALFSVNVCVSMLHKPVLRAQDWSAARTL